MSASAKATNVPEGTSSALEPPSNNSRDTTQARDQQVPSGIPANSPRPTKQLIMKWFWDNAAATGHDREAANAKDAYEKACEDPDVSWKELMAIADKHYVPK